MTTASAAFAKIPELVGCLAEQIRSRKQLATLCLINKTWNGAVTPILLREVHVGKPGQLLGLSSSKSLYYVSSFSLTSGVEGDNELLRKILPHMPQLESFSVSNIPVAPETIKALHDSCPKLKSLRISFPEAMDWWVLGLNRGCPPDPGQAPQRRIYRTLDLTVFKGLDELALDNLYDNLPAWRSQVVRILRTSPSIRKLRLSLAKQTLFRYDVCDERDKFIGFFDLLCRHYERTGGEPLPIQSLVLGTAVFPFQAGSVEKLIKLQDLEEVHVENKNVTHNHTIIDLYNSGQEESGILFEAFGPDRCPRLRRFTAAQYEKDVERLFAQELTPLFARQLAISCEEMGAGYELAALLRPSLDYVSLPVHLRMIDIDFCRDNVFLRGESGETDGEVPVVEKVLCDLEIDDEGALGGLAVHMEDPSNSESWWKQVDLLGNAAARLVNLTQLSILGNPLLSSWSEDDAEALRKTAHVLAATAPRLRYIQVYKHYFRVWRKLDDKFWLEELEDREIEDVELFHRTVWVPHT
ncbi:hypothetical protein VTK26DRAFT_1969 [Humicola hyalothermophila]